MKISRQPQISLNSGKTLIQNLYGEEKINQLISHLKKEIRKSKTGEVKRTLAVYSFPDINMYPEIAGKTLRSVSVRLREKEGAVRTRVPDLNENAGVLIKEAESYKKYLEDPELLKTSGFSYSKAENKPVCGTRVDCYEGIIDNKKTEIKISTFGLEIAETIKHNLQKLTFVDWAITEVLFVKQSQSGVESVIRKISKSPYVSYIEDKIKVFQKL